MAKDKSKSNRLNNENGFNTRVNLYIIRYLYYHMKKADQFMEDGKGKRKASIPLRDCIGISRQRLDRIFAGYNFSMAAAESKKLAELFNISTDHFKKNGVLIQLHDITQDDWKYFFYVNYDKSISISKKPDDCVKEKAEKVEKSLKESLEADYIESHYARDAALYRVYYYFAYGSTFKDASTLEKFLKNLKKLKISDWKELGSKPDVLKEYLPLLEMHYEYVSAYVKCRELEKK